MVRNDFQVTTFLAHGPLSEDLATDNELCIHLVHELACSLKHVDPAVDARIGAAAVPETRIANDVQVVFLLAQDGQADIQFTGGLGRLVLATGEDGLEV